jgi:hypothetical protein
MRGWHFMLKTEYITAAVTIIALIVSISSCGGNSAEETTPKTDMTESAAPIDTVDRIQAYKDSLLRSRTPMPEDIEAGSPEAELVEAIDEALAYVDKGDIKGLFKRFTPPEQYQMLIDSNALDVSVGRFEVFKGAFVEAMNEAKTVQPVFNDDTTRASFTVVDTPVPGGQVVFGKRDGVWYFSD